jgi:predicted DNA-binding ribbon-helix-helix protein
MQSTVAKRSIIIHGIKTSVSLEDAFWQGLREIARRRKVSRSELVEEIDAGRKEGNLSSAIRLFVLQVYQDQLGPIQLKQSGIPLTLVA